VINRLHKRAAFEAEKATVAEHRGTEPPLQSTLDALSTPVVLLDQAGHIIGMNTAWHEIARLAGRKNAISDLGANYLQICGAAAGDLAGAALRNGVSAVLAGKHRSFERTFRLLQDGTPRDFRVRIKRLEHYRPARFLVSHEEITELTRARESAREIGERVFEVQAEERQRLATELHDSIGQNLVSLGLWLSRLKMVTPQTDGVSTIITDMSAALQEAHAQIRTLSFLLRPPWPEQVGGLEKAIQQFVHGFGQRAGLAVEVRIDGPPCKLDRSRELTFFRILQEAIVNVHRHAHAGFVTVTLTNLDNEVALEVTDDGRGFPVCDGLPATPGVGILGMRARIMQFGGEFRIDTGPNGTALTARLSTAKPS
jgi:signal transduction histidine kinase